MGKILVQLNMVGEREVVMARAQEMGMGFVDLERVMLEGDVLRLLPAEIMLRLKVVPVKRDSGVLWLATARPPNTEALQEVGAITGCRVIPVLAVPSVIDNHLAKLVQPNE